MHNPEGSLFNRNIPLNSSSSMCRFVLVNQLIKEQKGANKDKQNLLFIIRVMPDFSGTYLRYKNYMPVTVKVYFQTFCLAFPLSVVTSPSVETSELLTGMSFFLHFHYYFLYAVINSCRSASPGMFSESLPLPHFLDRSS